MTPEKSTCARVDEILRSLPDLIEDRTALMTVGDVLLSRAGLAEYIEATSRLEKKRREFGHVVCAVEHLRHVIRQYYRDTSV